MVEDSSELADEASLFKYRVLGRVIVLFVVKGAKNGWRVGCGRLKRQDERLLLLSKGMRGPILVLLESDGRKEI